MKKLSVADAAEYFGVSKEAIHNRIRRGSLQSALEDGVKVVLLDEAQATPKKTSSARTHISKNIDEKYYRYLEEQNAKLQERVGTLEQETRTLREQKEQMLIEERMKIEQIYKEKDEQLKNIINAISTQIIQKTKELEMGFLKKEESMDVEIETVEVPSKGNLVSLKKYLKEKNYSSKKIEKIEKRFKKALGTDPRVVRVDKKYYIDVSRFDYEDLF